MDSIAFCPPHPDNDVSLRLTFPFLFRLFLHLTAIRIASPQPVPLLASTDASKTAQTFPPTHAKAGLPLHSSYKTFAALRAAHAQVPPPLKRANASKRKVAPSPEHRQSHPPAVPAVPDS